MRRSQDSNRSSIVHSVYKSRGVIQGRMDIIACRFMDGEQKIEKSFVSVTLT